MTHPTGTLEALSDDQRALLGRALEDALDRRTPPGGCADCDLRAGRSRLEQDRKRVP